MLDIARIPRKIFVGCKLSGVYKNRSDDNIARPPRFSNKTEMPFMQIPHRWNQADGSFPQPGLFGELLHLKGRNNDLHAAECEVKQFRCMSYEEIISKSFESVSRRSFLFTTRSMKPLSWTNSDF